MRTLAFLSLATWLVLLPFTQPEQQLRRQVEEDFHAGRYAEALAVMSAHSPDDFPPHWEPPPRHHRDELWRILDVWDEIPRSDPPIWVRQRFLKKLQTYLISYRGHVEDARVAGLLNHLPEAETFLLELAREPIMEGWLERVDSLLRPELRLTRKVKG